MKSGEVSARSAYGTAGYLTGSADLEALERSIHHDRPVPRRFTQVLVATDRGGEADFSYLDAVSYDALAERDFDLAAFAAPASFFPQTTFYAIDESRTDHLVDKAFPDRSWRIVNQTPGYNGRSWEYIPRWSCELLLRKCVARNRLSRCRLLSDRRWAQVLALVRDHRITDRSLASVTANGVCRAHPDDSSGLARAAHAARADRRVPPAPAVPAAETAP